MKIAYMPDTHGGPYNQPEPSRDAAARFCEQLLAEGIEAERSGSTASSYPSAITARRRVPAAARHARAYAARTTKVDLARSCCNRRTTIDAPRRRTWR